MRRLNLNLYLKLESALLSNHRKGKTLILNEFCATPDFQDEFNSIRSAKQLADEY